MESAETFEVARQNGSPDRANATWMRVIRGTYDQAREADIDRVGEQQYRPALQKTPGLKGTVHGRQDGRFATVLVYDTASIPERVPDSIANAFEAAGLHVETRDEFEINRQV